MCCQTLLFWLLTLTLIKRTRQQEIVSGFVNPPAHSGRYDYENNVVYLIGSKVRLNWVTNQDGYGVYLWQQDLTKGAAELGTSIYTKDPSAPETGGFTWTVGNQRFDITRSNVFFFALGINGTIGSSLISHYFNLTTDASHIRPTSTIISSATSPTTKPTSSSTETTASVAILTITPTATPVSQQESKGIGTAAKIGLGIGVGIGVPLILILAGILVIMAKRNRHNHNLPVYAPIYRDEGSSTPVQKIGKAQDHELGPISRAQAAEPYPPVELLGSTVTRR